MGEGALEIGCWNGERVRIAFVIDAFDREVIAHVAVTGTGISGSNIRDMMLAAVEDRFGADRAPHPIEHLSDNSSWLTPPWTHATSPPPSASSPASHQSAHPRATA